MCPACESVFTIGQAAQPMPPPPTSAVSEAASLPQRQATAEPFDEADRVTEFESIAEAELVSESKSSVDAEPVAEANEMIAAADALPPDWQASPAAGSGPAGSAAVPPPAEPPPGSDVSTPGGVYQSPAADVPLEPGVHPFSAPLAAGQIDLDPRAPPVATMQPAAAAEWEVQRLEIGQATIEEIVSATVAIFSMRWPPLVIAFLTIAMILLFAGFVPLTVISAIAEEGGEPLANILAVIWGPVFAVISGYFVVGMARVAIVVARNAAASPMSEMIPPLPLALRFLVGAFLLTVVFVIFSASLAALVAALGSVAGNPQLVSLLGLFAVLMSTAVVLVIGWLLWPWWMIVSDGKASMLAAVRLSEKLTMNNKKTSCLLIVIAIVLAGIGTAICSVGHFLTAPLTVLMFAVAYLKMTNQPVDTRSYTMVAAAPPPSEPTF
jgi:hypothetical protein